MGYPKESFGYYFYNLNEQKVFVSRHAIFLEREFILEMASGSQIELDEVREPQSRKEKEVEQELLPHDDTVKEKKIGNFGRFFGDFSVFGGSGKKNPWKKSTEKISAKNRKNPIFPEKIRFFQKKSDFS